MKFVKENLTLVICGAVILLAIAGFWYMTGMALGSVRTQMQTRYDETRNRIRANTNKKLEFPGGDNRDGVPPQSFVDIKKGAIDTIEAYKKDVDLKAKEFNSAGRVVSNAPMLPALQGNGKSLALFLPELKQPAMEFKAAYLEQFRNWRSALTASGPEVSASLPPSQESLNQLWTEQLERIKASAPPGPAGLGQAATENTREKIKFFRDRITARATGLRMYIEPGGFQVRQWGLTDDPPEVDNIFEALVDSWIQADIVRAINEVNKTTGHDINNSPVKRLTRIVVGNNARTRMIGASSGGGIVAGGGAPAGDPGLLFFTAANAGAMGGGGGIGGTGGTMTSVPTGQPGTPDAQAQGAGGSNKVDYQFSMTGHTSAQEYDVVLFSVVLDVKPQSLNNFIDALYRRNMGYIMLNLQLKTVDPIDRVSHGYLYGDGDVVEAEILFEAIMFRSWSLPIMPKGIKTSLGIQDPPK